MEKSKILLVEDDFNLGIVIQDFLSLEGYSVHLCRDGKEGLQKFNKNEYDVCLLDVMLPEKDGYEIAEDIRKVNKEIPIIFLTAKSNPEDKVKGFKAGGDDYITKPFNREEFLLRIKAILRRANNDFEDDENEGLIKLNSFELDFRNLKLSHPKEDKKLTKRETAILKLLCENRNKVIERSLVLNLIWGDDNYFNGRSLDVFITKLRKYLAHDETISINNIHGVGFKLELNEK
ncbi:response regulator transcription factor [Flavobacteriales bacterium]|jgi:DNA-binding response OmpR family regulator|nr:response regulator transcription factor [Flavobacteriales bacterium]MDB4195640.1 response regulator transcription factor [Flavobacteriales bacterium]MDC0015338.1 response regulator transcription factor [Flavobacteriales bacterium]MDG1176412.1 response regulator transcription factor [Flavobacteriales bacterium]|tara:strand:- start:957 stop:1655 length:699 start_codon:yes stop_codon:yes gene_type:complete